MPTDSATSEKAFVDTNIFAYSEDMREPDKRAIALALIERLTEDARMVISTQVINEFCAVLLRGKVGSVATEEEMRVLVDEMEASAEVVIVTPEISREAVRGVFAYRLSWFDALIWASARAGGCAVIYTEDMPGMAAIEGIRYVNPFAEGHEPIAELI